MTGLSLLAPLALFGLLLALARLETRQFGPPGETTRPDEAATSTPRGVTVHIDPDLLTRVETVMGHTRGVEETVDAALRGFIVERDHSTHAAAPAAAALRRRIIRIPRSRHTRQPTGQTISTAHSGTAGHPLPRVEYATSAEAVTGEEG